MISIKYDLPPSSGERFRLVSPLSLSLRRSLRSHPPPSTVDPPPAPPPPRSMLSYPRGVTWSLTSSLIIFFECTVRNSPVTRTRTHVPRPQHIGRLIRRSPIIRFHRIFVVPLTWPGHRRIPVPGADPPINPVNALAPAIKSIP